MMCVLCLFFVTLWNDKVCDNGNAIKQRNFQNSYGVIHRGRFVHCVSKKSSPLGLS